MAMSQTFLGVGGWLHNVQGKYHVFSETVSTLRSALELKAVFDQISAAEKAGGLSAEERQRLEEQAAEKGLQALFKVGHDVAVLGSMADNSFIRALNSRLSPSCEKCVTESSQNPAFPKQRSS